MPVRWGVHQIPQINLDLNLSRCRVALRPAVLSAARIWPSVSRYLEISFQAFTPFEGGWVHCPAPEAPLTRGMPRGPRVFLTNSGRVWATALRPVPPKKRPCAIHARKVGRASNTADQSRSEPLQVSGSASAGRVICGTDLAKCVSVPGDFLRPQGAFPPGFYLLREGWVHCPAPEAPLTRGMPRGPRVFLTNSGRVWATALRPVPPKKKALCHTCP